MSHPEQREWLGVELRHFIALRTVAHERGFHRAAQRLGYSQSAISQQIGALERIVGVKLLERPRGAQTVRLTPAGETLVRHAHAIEERLAAAKADLAMIAAGRNAALRIGSFQTIGVHILPEVLSRFMEAWPEARIQLTESVNDLELAEAVRRGELDVAYVVLPLPAPDDALEVTDLLEDPFVFAAQAGSGVLRPDMLDSADGLKEIPLVCFQSCRATERVLRTLRTELGVEPRIVLRSDDNETLKGMAAAGAAVALFPGLSLEPHDSELDVVALPPKIGPRVISLVRRRDRWLTAPMTDFISLSVTVSREVHARTQAEPFGSAG